MHIHWLRFQNPVIRTTAKCPSKEPHFDAANCASGTRATAAGSTIIANRVADFRAAFLIGRAAECTMRQGGAPFCVIRETRALRQLCDLRIRGRSRLGAILTNCSHRFGKRTLHFVRLLHKISPFSESESSISAAFGRWVNAINWAHRWEREPSHAAQIHRHSRTQIDRRIHATHDIMEGKKVVQVTNAHLCPAVIPSDARASELDARIEKKRKSFRTIATYAYVISRLKIGIEKLKPKSAYTCVEQKSERKRRREKAVIVYARTACARVCVRPNCVWESENIGQTQQE